MRHWIETNAVNWDDPIIEAAETDTGMRRSNNQDSHIIVRAANPESWRKHGHVFMVADGMGAHAVGELASKMACENIPHNYKKMKNLPTREAIIKAYQEVGAQIHAKSSANRDFQGMGTTCSTLLVLPEGAMLAHVGDSRVYRTRGGQLDQLTFDHSLHWELERGKFATAEQLSKAPKNIITRSLGPEPTVEVDIEGPYPIEAGDVFLLCSDGLSGPVKDPEIGAFMSEFHPADACRYLLQLANLRGGADNITVVIVRFGPWADPDNPAASVEGPAPAKAEAKRGLSLASLVSAFRRKPPEEPVEEHLYTSTGCGITEELVDGIANLVRKAQQVAMDQSWGVDWGQLAEHRREADQARQDQQLRRALRSLGEAIVLLGFAGRIHRKAQAAGAR